MPSVDDETPGLRGPGGEIESHQHATPTRGKAAGQGDGTWSGLGKRRGRGNLEPRTGEPHFATSPSPTATAQVVAKSAEATPSGPCPSTPVSVQA